MTEHSTFVTYVTGKRAAHLAGVTYRKLDYWIRTDRIRLDSEAKTGSGNHRSITSRDILQARAIEIINTLTNSLESAASIAETLDVDNLTAVVTFVPPGQTRLTYRIDLGLDPTTEQELIDHLNRNPPRDKPTPP